MVAVGYPSRVEALPDTRVESLSRASLVALVNPSVLASGQLPAPHRATDISESVRLVSMVGPNPSISYIVVIMMVIIWVRKGMCSVVLVFLLRRNAKDLAESGAHDGVKLTIKLLRSVSRHTVPVPP